MTLQSTAARTVMLIFISGWILHSGSGVAAKFNSQRSRVLSLKRNRVRGQLRRPVHDGLVSFMSVEESKAGPVPILPNLPTLAGQLGLNTLVADVVKAGLTPALYARGPLTVLGPNDVAFNMVPGWLKTALQNTTELAQILKFHVLKGRLLMKDIRNELTVETALGIRVRFNVYPNNLTTAQCALIDDINKDKMASNGVLHELKQVIWTPQGSLVQVASLCPAFKTLVAALETAGLAKTLSEKGPYTLFAPTEAAFQKLDPQTRDKLMKNQTALTDLLKYHVTEKTYCSAGLVSFGKLNMLNGEQVNITVDAKTVRVNDAAIMPSGVDGSVSNGVMHAIDSVLIPPSLRHQLDSPSSSDLAD
ncbi:hypothetical protein ACOMHN_016306 [Nucella lapillus]